MELMDLPTDLHETIVDKLLLSLPEPLFAPIYGTANDDIGDYGDLENKVTENYGQRDDNQLECAQALMNWSSTCHFFRKLLSPRLFKCIILRSRPKSVASIKAVMLTDYWKRIESFIFVATEHEYNENGKLIDLWGDPVNDETTDNDQEDSGQHDLGAEMSELHSIMCNLPPGLKSLTLDFPNGWTFGEWTEHIMDGGVWDSSNATQGLRYRAQLQTAIESTCLNDISSKPSFELKLLSVPTVHCAAYETEAFHQFLNNITSFTIALCHWDSGAGWNMNTIADMGDACTLAQSLSDFFLNHLESAETLHLYADGSWPLGDANVARNWVDVDFPLTADTMPVLKHVSFKQFFICNQLQDFIFLHLHNLDSIDLADCFASAEEPNESPNWTSFFSSIVDARPKHLRRLTVSNPSKTLEDLLGSESDEKSANGRDHENVVARRKVLDELKAQEAEKQAQIRSARNKEHIGRYQKQVLAHVTVDDKYGFIFDSEEVNAEVYLKGAAHNEWRRVMDLLEENRKRV